MQKFLSSYSDSKTLFQKWVKYAFEHEMKIYHRFVSLYRRILNGSLESSAISGI